MQSTKFLFQLCVIQKKFSSIQKIQELHPLEELIAVIVEIYGLKTILLYYSTHFLVKINGA